MMENILDYFVDKNTSLGQSYLCESSINEIDSERCFFIYHKQLRNEDQYHLSFMEGVTLVVLSLLIVPANVVALQNFKEKRLNPDFKLLVTMLCIYNFFMAIIGVINGISRFSNTFPLGHWGCGFYIVISSTVNTCTAYTLTWLSIERRKATCVTNLKNSQTSSCHIKIVALMISLYFIFWTGLSFFIPGFHLHPHEMENGIETQICVIKSNYHGMVGIGTVMFSFITFFVPLLISIFNFGFIFKNFKKFLFYFTFLGQFGCGNGTIILNLMGLLWNEDVR